MKICNYLRIMLAAFAIALSSLPGVQSIHAQSNSGEAVIKPIMGRVFDEEGEPLPGATVRIKGLPATEGALTTDANGTFGFKYDMKHGANPVLEVSYIGMQTQDVKVDFKKPLKIQLEPDALKLTEVTVVDDGYNRLPRRDMVGSYTTLKAEDVIIPGYQSIDQMLQGRVAGMVVSNSSARVGASPSIKIRGTSTLLGSTDPLWVVDGVIQPDPIHIDASDALTEDMSTLIGNQVSWLNPLDIETITVLKDASATAIYGSRASNGVIVVTTKKGSSEHVSVRYQGGISIRERKGYEHYNMMNSLERIQFSKEAYDAGARYASTPLAQTTTYEGLMEMYNKRMITEAEFAKHMQRLETVNTDWFDLLTRNSLSTNHNVSVSGGSDKVTYNGSVGYSVNNGTEVGNSNNQFTSRLNVGIQFSKRLRVTINMNGSYRQSNGYASGVNPSSYALSTSRSIPAFKDNGEYEYYYQPYNSYPMNSNQLELGYNILNEMDNSYSKNTNKSFTTSLNADFKILDWMTYTFGGSVNQSNNNLESYLGEKTSYVEMNYRGYPAGSQEYGSDLYKAAMLPVGGQLNTSASQATAYSMSHKMTMSQTYAEKHRINLLLGFEMRSVQNSSNTNTTYGYVPERGQMMVAPTPPKEIVPIGKTPYDWGVYERMFRYGNGWRKYDHTDNQLSFFGVLAYSFNNIHVLNANFRWDASNRFGQDTNHQFNPTYSFGYSWRVAQQEFIQNSLPWLNQMNLRATYGIQGNVVNSVSPDLLAAYGVGGLLAPYNQYYATISSLPNPYLNWESTKTWNFGADMQFFHKFTLNLEYYTRESNVILQQNIAEEYGMKTMRLNGGKLHNHGLELTFNYTPISRKDLALTIGLNASKNWNRSDNPEELVRANQPQYSDYLSGNKDRPLKEGFPVSAFWSYSFAGLDPATGYPTFNLLDVEPGDDPTNFMVYSGQTEAYFTGGFNFRLRYKEISLGSTFSSLIGAKRRLPNPYSGFSNGKIPDPWKNLDRDLNNRWKQPGDEKYTIIPALWTAVGEDINYRLPTTSGNVSSRYEMWANSDAMVADASFLRCNNITLSYYLPQKWCNSFGAQSLNLSASVSNIFTIASKRWKGFDPELGNSVMPHIYSVTCSLSF